MEQGDLLLVVEVKPHDVFERSDRNLKVAAAVDVVTAVLGGQLTIPTLTGPVRLKIPPGTQGGQTFRLKGKGMPKLENRHQHGDLLAEIRVVLPEHLSEEERRLFQELATLRSSGR